MRGQTGVFRMLARSRSAAGPRLALAVLALGMVQLTGCAAQNAPPPVISKEVGSPDQPTIISSRPEQDSLAFAAGTDSLTAADWQRLEELGPRPIWEKLVSWHSRLRHHDAAPPSTRPATSATTQPALDESQLPIEVVNLPDGKIRIIWTLRNYGGTTVKTTRDPVTNRQKVDVTAPDLAALVTTLGQDLGAGNTVSALPPDNAIVVTCDKGMRSAVLSLLNDVDQAPHQVEIAAKIFEVSHDFDFQQGTELVLNGLSNSTSANLTSTFSAKRFLDALTNPTGAPVQGSVLHLMQAFQDAGVSLDVSFQLLASSGLIKVVSEPRMTVAVGQTGYMLAGQEIPIQSSSITNNVVLTSTTYKPVGVQLYITPEASGPKRVKLHTISIVSAVSGFGPVPTMAGGYNPVLNPVIDSREAETAVTVGDGSTLVISGLRMIRTTTREDKIPGLGDVPGLGWLFKNHRTQQEQTDLYFFITPTMM